MHRQCGEFHIFETEKDIPDYNKRAVDDLYYNKPMNFPIIIKSDRDGIWVATKEQALTRAKENLNGWQKLVDYIESL